MRDEWGEDRGEGLSNVNAPPLPSPLLFPASGGEGENSAQVQRFKAPPCSQNFLPHPPVKLILRTHQYGALPGRRIKSTISPGINFKSAGRLHRIGRPVSTNDALAT